MYALKMQQLLTELMKAKQLAKCNLLLSMLKHEASSHLCFFSDKKILTAEMTAGWHKILKMSPLS